MNIALVKAGGVGARMKASVPKQFICVQDKPIIIYTLEAFEKHPNIDAIVVVCVDGWHDILRSYAEKFHITKLTNIVSGGETSLKSIRAGVKAIECVYSPEDTVLIHDGNRPMISQEIISDVLSQRAVYGSAVAAIPCTDEIMLTDGVQFKSEQFMDRKKLYRIQTPDAYSLETLQKLFSMATEEHLNTLGATNTLMIALGKSVHFAQGSELNIRLTTQEDILLCESLLNVRNEKRGEYNGCRI